MGGWERGTRGRGYGDVCIHIADSLFLKNILKINLFILFISFWLRWVFIAACRLSLVVASGGYSSLWCTGSSLQWLLLLQSMSSRCMGFSSCGTWAQ